MQTEIQKLSNRELDAAIAEEVLNLKCWREKRGEYSLCVTGDAPWKVSRDDRQDRYTPVTCAQAQRIGFFGTGIPRYTTDPAESFRLIEWMATSRRNLTIKLNCDKWEVHNYGVGCYYAGDLKRCIAEAALMVARQEAKP